MKNIASFAFEIYTYDIVETKDTKYVVKIFRIIELYNNCQIPY